MKEKENETTKGTMAALIVLRYFFDDVVEQPANAGAINDQNRRDRTRPGPSKVIHVPIAQLFCRSVWT